MNLSAVIIKYVVDLLDSNKRRHKIRRKINEDKSTLAAAIEDFNEQSVHQLPSVDELLTADHFQWPWECPDTSN